MAATVRAGQGATPGAHSPQCLARMLPRICIPIRHQDLLLGYLWPIDADESMGPEQITLAETIAQDLASALRREALVGELASNQVRLALEHALIATGCR